LGEHEIRAGGDHAKGFNGKGINTGSYRGYGHAKARECYNLKIGLRKKTFWQGTGGMAKEEKGPSSKKKGTAQAVQENLRPVERISAEPLKENSRSAANQGAPGCGGIRCWSGAIEGVENERMPEGPGNVVQGWTAGSRN